jgi:hypothetical protein
VDNYPLVTLFVLLWPWAGLREWIFLRLAPLVFLSTLPAHTPLTYWLGPMPLSVVIFALLAVLYSKYYYVSRIT